MAKLLLPLPETLVPNIADCCCGENCIIIWGLCRAYPKSVAPNRSPLSHV